MKRVYLFGNPDLENDSLPLRIAPGLRKEFPSIEFETMDPNEEWPVTGELTIIDTVLGIEAVTVFENLEPFRRSPSLSLHDFDALANLLLLEKLGKLGGIRIIGLPPDIAEKEAVEEVSRRLREG